MNWRIAESLKQLRKQIDEMFPLRSKISDGAIGDAAHASRKSDHNPWISDGRQGVVSAIDITHDPLRGVDCNKLADALFASKDPRIKYLIWNGRITEPDMSGWKNYSGLNAHKHHLHISVNSSRDLYDSTEQWDVSALISRLNPPEKAISHPSAEKAEAALPENAPPAYYTVRAGDTIWGIAKKHNITESELRRINNIDSKSSLIKIGQKMRVK